MDNVENKAEMPKKHQRSPAKTAVLVIAGLIVLFILLLAADSFGPSSVSRTIDAVGLLPVCVYNQGVCQPCYGSCSSQPRGNSDPCLNIQDVNARITCEMNTAKPPQRVCRRMFGFKCMTFSTGPE